MQIRYILLFSALGFAVSGWRLTLPRSHSGYLFPFVLLAGVPASFCWGIGLIFLLFCFVCRSPKSPFPMPVP